MDNMTPAKESRLLSPEELTRDAESFDFYSTMPLSRWLRTAKTLQSQVVSCEQQGDLPRAYMLATRHATLVLQKIPTYPKHEQVQLKDQMKQAFKQVSLNLPKLEKWKPIIRTQYEKELQASRVRKAAALRREQQIGKASFAIEDDDDDNGIHDLYSKQHSSLDATEHRDVARELAHKALSQRQSSQSWVRDKDTGIPAMLQDTRKLLDRQSPVRTEARSSNAYHYPDVPARRMTAIPSSPPSVPQKLSRDLPLHLSSPLAPPLPSKQPATSPASQFKITAYTEGGEALRTVFLPSSLQTKFLNLADRNTSRDLETCGVLCASLMSNALMITHLVIPDQTSTSDTCDTTEDGDNALFEFCDERELVVCGWIHTHPSQTCFLSSRDLHTSAGYQLMLPEAIAIVCSPRHNPSSGIFRLTSPPGLPAVLKCQTRGLFHSHDESNLYTDAMSPGHVVTDSKMQFEVVDLRLK